MKTIVDGYKEAIKENGREIDAKITYTLNGNEIELGSEILNSLTPHYEGGILKSVMKQLDIDSNEDIPLETQINAQFGLKVNDEYKYINLGDYIVYSSEKQEDTKSYKIIAYDKLLYSMKPYDNKHKNIFNSNVVQGFYTADGGTSTSNTQIRTIEYIEVKPNETYTFSNTNNLVIDRLCYYDESETFISRSSYINNKTFTIPNNNCKYIRFTIRASDGSNITPSSLVNPQIEQGNEASNYHPYGTIQYPITIRNYIQELCDILGIDFANANDTFVNYNKEIESELYLDDEGYSLDFTYRDVLDQLAQVTASTICINDDNELEIRYINDTQGKNLLNVTMKSFTQNGLTFTHNEDGSITINGTSIRNGQMNLCSQGELQLNAGTYMMSSKNNIPSSTWLTLRENNRDHTSMTNLNKKQIVLTNNSINAFVYFYYNNNVTINNLTIYPMIEKGASATDFEPYGDTIDEEYLKDINVNFG